MTLQEESKRSGMVFIPPYDDPYVIAGQGTTGAEIIRQLNSAQKENLEAIFVAIGGGGLAAGIASYTKQLLPHVKVFGVEPAGISSLLLLADATSRSPLMIVTSDYRIILQNYELASCIHSLAFIPKVILK